MEIPDNTTQVSLKSALTIAYTGEVKTLLLSALSGTEDLLLDVKEITEVDIAGLQLLCAVHRGALYAGKSITLDYTKSPILARTLAQAGYIRHAGCMANEKCFWLEVSHG